MRDPLCATPQNIKLFSSATQVPFDTTEWRENNPNKTYQDLLNAKKQHQLDYERATATTKKICLTCPLIQACTKKALASAEPIYGTVGALTEVERFYLKNRSVLTSIPRMETTSQYRDLDAEIASINSSKTV